MGSVFQKQSRKFMYSHRNVKLTKAEGLLGIKSQIRSVGECCSNRLQETPCTCVHVLSALATGHLKWACQPQIGQTPVLQVFKQIVEIKRTLLAPVASNSLLRVACWTYSFTQLKSTEQHCVGSYQLQSSV